MIASRVSHILLPIDFGPSSESALRYAKMLTAKFGASLQATPQERKFPEPPLEACHECAA